VTIVKRKDDAKGHGRKEGKGRRRTPQPMGWMEEERLFCVL
jgi:ribosomal protein L19E